jgi:ankyrin repeat protein
MEIPASPKTPTTFPLHDAITSPETSQGLENFLREGADTSLRNKEGLAALHVAVRLDRPDATQTLLKYGTNAREETRGFETGSIPLHFVVSIKCAQALLDDIREREGSRGVKTYVNTANAAGITPLQKLKEALEARKKDASKKEERQEIQRTVIFLQQ